MRLSNACWVAGGALADRGLTEAFTDCVQREFAVGQKVGHSIGDPRTTLEDFEKGLFVEPVTGYVFQGG